MVLPWAFSTFPKTWGTWLRPLCSNPADGCANIGGGRAHANGAILEGSVYLQTERTVHTIEQVALAPRKSTRCTRRKPEGTTPEQMMRLCTALGPVQWTNGGVQSF